LFRFLWTFLLFLNQRFFLLILDLNHCCVAFKGFNEIKDKLRNRCPDAIHIMESFNSVILNANDSQCKGFVISQCDSELRINNTVMRPELSISLKFLLFIILFKTLIHFFLYWINICLNPRKINSELFYETMNL
jgi:hypothetical protein